jgi:hypothetical protein
MTKLSEKTIEKLEEKINFTEAFSAVNYLHSARSNLNNETIDDVQKLVKMLNDVTDGYEIEDSEELFELADEIESYLYEVQENLEKVVNIVSSVVECWPDPDEEFEDEEE